MKRAALLLLLTGWLTQAFATHIVGGEIMYNYLGDNGSMVRYRVTMYLYIDCINGQPGAIEDDKRGYINVFSYNKFLNRFTLYPNSGNYYPVANARSGPQRVSDVNYKCIKTKPNACVDKYTYSLDISVPINDDGYTISFERCCRNNTINNIVNPMHSGATYWTHIPGHRTRSANTSPFFNSLPPNFLCTNAPLKFDHSATDADGDSLVYELYHPYLGADRNDPLPSATNPTNPNNFSNIIWENGYSTYANQIDGNPTLSIDRETGKLSLTPTRTGQFVIGIKVMEFRNGIFIGETKRDFQFNVNNCNFEVVSSFMVPKLNCTGTEVTFNNFSIGGLKYQWDFGVEETDDDTSNFTHPKFTYPNPGQYKVRLVASTTKCSDTFDYDLTVKQNFKTDIGRDTLICGPFSMQLQAIPADKPSYIWNTGERTKNITVNKGGVYWVSVSDAPCISRDTIQIVNDLTKIDLGPDSVICRDSFVPFTYEGKPGFSTYLWNDSSFAQFVFIPRLDTYHVRVTNQNNCASEDSITFILYPPPRTLLKDTLFCKGTSVILDGINRSALTVAETQYLWNTGSTAPAITVSQPGTYIVKLRNKLCTLFDTAVLNHIETGLELGPDTFYCGPVFRWLRPKKGFVSYVWHDGAESADYLATTPGKKKLTITTIEGCVESDSVLITQFPVIDGGLGNDTAICLSSTLWLHATDSFVSYLWNTGQESRSISVQQAGTYRVIFRDRNGCIGSDSITIVEQADALPVDLFMPNAFTPNDDGLNELFPGNGYADPGSPYLLRIYNRWGEKIWESESPAIEWDGRIKGDMAPQDVYVFTVRYTGCDNLERTFRGTFTLMR